MSASGDQAGVTAADMIAARLRAAGCRYAFGIPGGEVVQLIDALVRAGIAFVLTRHENVAGFMAEGVHYADGAPGILVTTLGPGLTNAVTAIANAMQERVPLIVLSGCVDPAEAASYTHQVFDHAALLAPITKAQFRAVDGAIDTMLERALLVALEGRPGPVHIDLPVGLATRRQPPCRTAIVPLPAAVAPAPGPARDAACRLIAGAERPLILAGLDVPSQRAEGALRDFAEALGIPVLTTYKAKGVLPEDHPLSLGAAGLSPKADEIILPFVRASDLVLLVGYDPIEMRAGWVRPFGRDQTVIELSAAAPTHLMHQARFGFVGDIAAGLAALRPANADRTAVRADVPATRAALAAAFAPRASWGPGAIIATARRILPRDTIATADSGAHRILLSQMWRCYGARTLRQSTGLCTMGCALPLAMAARLAEPAAPVVAFIGDGGIEMVLGDLATARALGLSLIVIVFADASLALIELKQRKAGLPEQGVALDRTDFAAVATAMGCRGIAVRDADGLARAIEAGLDDRALTLIACEFPAGSYDGLF